MTSDRGSLVPAEPEIPGAAVEPTPAGPPRSRRSLLVAGLSGAAGLVLGALGRPAAAEAAAGEPLMLGQANDSGTSQTTLQNAGLGAAFTLRTSNLSTGATGIFGWTSQTGANATRGVYGKADGPNANAVVGRQTGPAGGGSAIVAEGNQNIGLLATTANGSSYAVFGENFGDDGIAVVGYVPSTDPAGLPMGVAGQSDAPNGAGTLGYHAAIDGGGYGLLGWTESALGWGVYSVGDMGTDANLYVSGTVSKAGGSFKIDHPLDPAKKFLYHSFVELPDMKNVYDGVATLDANGEVTVELPPYFEALNRDVRYQLTAMDEFAPLYVSSAVKNGRFSIAGGKAGQQVCWQVTGIRQDAWAEAHRIPVEEAKSDAEKGLYLHPREHGQSQAKGINRVRAKMPRRPIVETP